ncbi:sterol desaturase family protein [Sandaracinus amylolyticus]|uniref:Sterol desaturase family protein n=1 Tax=Sandaracinus amylolyticus TaxID=927083 RepID=A0A0F6YIG6_9BACT|nr:sterol desaturase family protein [Sandaracinus amylolyticus]AKF05097.1 sterol desaturase family protein [Sandaracinus amylolyticus]
MGETGGTTWMTVGISVGVSLVTFWGLGGLVHWWFYVHRRADAERWKVQPRRFLSRAMVRHAFALGSFNIVMGAVIGGLFASHVARGGWSTLYSDPLEHGVPWLLASAVATYFVIDAGLYYSHRALHGRWLFRHVHRWHHRYTAPVIFTTTAVHPIEFLVFQAFVMLPVVVVPVHWAVYLLVVAYTYLIGMIDHSGVIVRWPLPLHPGNQFHDDHHVFVHCNYGHHTQVFDRLHGTVRANDRRYADDELGEGARRGPA